MKKFFSSLTNTIIAGVVILIVMILLVNQIAGGQGDGYYGGGVDNQFYLFLVRWLHVLAGVMWIGLLWYFNFVQTPGMPKIPDDQKPAISKVIAPSALFWFRWGAMFTLIFGLWLAWINGYILDALTLGLASGDLRSAGIGFGMWFGIIMWFNVWFIIWPKQKKALGIVEVDPDTKAASAATAGMYSRINTMLSIPMFYAMVSAQNPGAWNIL